MVGLILFLCGMVLPITMVAAALAYDAGMLTWLLYRGWHDSWAPAVWRVIARRTIAIVSGEPIPAAG